jgi:hypothetical protein
VIYPVKPFLSLFIWGVPDLIWDIMPFALTIEPSYIAIFDAENLNIGCILALS